MDIVAQLRKQAAGSAEACQMLARAKSERNQAAGDPHAIYDGGTPQQMLEWRAADEIERLRKIESAASNVCNTLTGGFIRCRTCGSQEDTTDIDFAADLRAALNPK